MQLTNSFVNSREQAKFDKARQIYCALCIAQFFVFSLFIERIFKIDTSVKAEYGGTKRGNHIFFIIIVSFLSYDGKHNRIYIVSNRANVEICFGIAEFVDNYFSAYWRFEAQRRKDASLWWKPWWFRQQSLTPIGVVCDKTGHCWWRISLIARFYGLSNLLSINIQILLMSE